MILRLLSQVPAWFVRASLEAALIALLVLAAQSLLRDRVSARWRYNLWLLVVARLLLPALPQSRLSPFNWMQVSQGARVVEQMPVARSSAPVKPIPMPTVQPVKPSDRKAPIQIAEVEKRTIEEARYIDVPVEMVDAKDSAPAREPEQNADSTDITNAVFPKDEPLAAPRRGKPAADTTRNSGRGVSDVIRIGGATISQWTRTHRRAMGLAAWASVAALLLLRSILTSIRVTLIARRLKPIEDAWVVQLLGTCCTDAGISRAPMLVQSSKDIGPALVGFLNPRLLLPARVLEALNRNELRLVILHELVHLRRRDVAMNWLLALLGALHWFNPVLWWAFARLRADRELTCDEAVLDIGRRAGAANDARDYGRAMLKLLEAFSGGTSSPAAVGVLDGHPRWRNALMRRRITMIARFDKPKGWSLIGMSVSLLIGAIALTGAVRGQSAPSDAQNAGAAGAPPKPGTTSVIGKPAEARPGMMGAGTAQNSPAMGWGLPGMPSAPVGGAAISATPPGAGPTGIGAASPGASPFGAPPAAGQTPAANPFGGPSGIGAGAPPAAGGAVPPAAGGAAPSDESRFGHVEGPDAARADARTSENLRKPLTVAFNDVALGDLTSYLADQTGADVFIDNKALEEIGIDRNTPINLKLRQPLPAEEVLRLALRSAGGDNIGYGVFHGVVTITSRLQLERSQITRAYSIPDFDNRGDELINAITRTIAPETWDTHGGPSSILILGKRMIVTTAEPRHREIARLLALLREGEPGPRAEAVQPQTPPAAPQAAVDPIFRALNSDPELSRLREIVRNLQVESDTLAQRGDTDAAAMKARVRYKRARDELDDLESQLTHQTVDALKGVVTTLKSQLEDFERQRGAEHPDVIGLKAKIADTERYIARWTQQGNAAGTPAQQEVQIHGVAVPVSLADAIVRLWDQYQAKVYYINHKPQNQAQVDAEFKEQAERLKTLALANQQQLLDLQKSLDDQKKLLATFHDDNNPKSAEAVEKFQAQLSQVQAHISNLHRQIAHSAKDLQNTMRVDPTRPPSPAPQEGADTVKERPELQSSREAAKDFEKLAQDLADRGDTGGAETARKYVDEYNRKIAKLQEESRIDRTDGGAKDSDPDPRLFELQNLREVAKNFERLSNDLADRGDTRGAQRARASVDETNKKIATLGKVQPDDTVASLKAKLDAAQRQLEELRAKNYLEGHPLVVRTKDRIDELMKMLAQLQVSVDVNGVRVPGAMADEARRILKDQFEPKIYSIGGVEQNRAQIDEEFRKYIQKLVEGRTSSTSDPSPKTDLR